MKQREATSMVIKKVSHGDQGSVKEWSCGVHPKPFGNVVGSPAVPATDSMADLGELQPPFLNMPILNT